LPVHNHLNGDSHDGISHKHEHQEHKSRNDAPGRAVDEVARSGANTGPESEVISIDIPGQIACKTKLEGSRVSLITHVCDGGRTSTIAKTMVKHRTTRGFDQHCQHSSTHVRRKTY